MPKSTQEFFSILESMNNGRTLTALEQKLQEVLNSVAETEGAGELNVKLKVTFGKKNLHKVTAIVTSKLPQEQPEVAVFYLNQENKLVRDDPRQTEMFPRVVSKPAAESTGTEG